MKARNPRRGISRGVLHRMLTELVLGARQSIANSWLARISLAATAVLLLGFVWTKLINVFATQGFGPHGECLLWLPSLIALFAGSDTSIGLAYVFISATLIYLVYRARHAMPFQWIFVAFGIFIIACGATHLLDVLTLWVPAYWFLGTVKLLTALASVTTALALPPQIPRVMNLIHLASEEEERKRRQLEEAHRELAGLYEKSRDLDRLKTMFFANVNHDLRTPLTLILGPTRTLLTEHQLTQEQSQALEIVQRNALTLLKQVNDLLSLAQLEIGGMTLNTTVVDLASLLRGCAAHFEALAQERQLTLTVGGPSSLLACIDAEKFQQICLNLLSNAFKFAPPGGWIRCTLSQEEEQGIIIVEDNGPGVRSELRQAIFERFWQGPEDSARAFGGRGLGLAIVKEFVELHNGSITVGDSLEGGALFTTTFPLGAVASVSPQPNVLPIPVSEEQVSPFLRDLSREPQDKQDLLQIRQSSSLAEPAPVVLVIEDHPDMAHFLVDILAPEYHVVVAEDGQDGFTKALSLQPDLMLCDLIMPHMSGEQFIEQVRKQQTLDAVPIMVLSAHADDTLRVRLLREGIQEYLVKPFFPEELRARIANLIAMKQTRHVLQQEVVSQHQSLVLLAREVALRKRESQQAFFELQRANEELVHASQMQRNFVAVVSHEFRTALTGIQGFSELMSEVILNPAEVKEFAADIFSEANRLGRMITDLLDLERMKSGQMTLTLERVDLNALIHKVLDYLRLTPEGHTFRLQLDDALPVCMGDSDKLAQVITNLLSNALKYSPDGGEILVGSRAEQGLALVWVQDHGVGIPSEFLEDVFIPYSRIDAGTTRYIKGTGLGLSISRQIIQMHRGHISVESSLGQGSRFSFTLPL